MCKRIFEWQSVTYHFRGTVTLTSDQVFQNNNVWSISLEAFQIGDVWVHLEMEQCRVLFMGQCDL